MFFKLVLAHFLGDYLFQSNWMASRKNKFWVLILHVSIHFLLMMLLAGSIRFVIWPQLIGLMLVHLFLDSLKISLSKKWRSQRVPLYFMDQVVHLFTIWGTVKVARIINPDLVLNQTQPWVIIAIAYLVATYVWFISERVIYQWDKEYLINIDETKFPRMLARAGMVSMFFFFRGIARLSFAFFLNLPYPTSTFRKRAFFSDLAISLSAIIFLFFTLGIN